MLCYQDSTRVALCLQAFNAGLGGGRDFQAGLRVGQPIPPFVITSMYVLLIRMAVVVDKRERTSEVLSQSSATPRAVIQSFISRWVDYNICVKPALYYSVCNKDLVGVGGGAAFWVLSKSHF